MVMIPIIPSEAGLPDPRVMARLEQADRDVPGLTVDSLHFRSVGTLLAQAEALNIEDVVEGLIPSGAITLILGGPKAGKTTTLASLLEAMTTGTPWCGQKVQRGHAWVMIDEGVRSIAELLNDVGPHRGEHLFSLVSDHAGSTWPVIVNQIIQLYEAEEKRLGQDAVNNIDRLDYADGTRIITTELPKMIVFDTLGRWSKLGDIRSYGESIAAFEHLQQLRDRTGLAIVCLHHTRKEGGSVTDSSLGSQALTGQADVVLRVSPDADEEQYPNRRSLQLMGRFRGGLDTLFVEKVGPVFVKAEGGRLPSGTRDADTLVMGAAEDGEEFSVSGMHRLLKDGNIPCGLGAIRSAVSRLHKAGQLVDNGQAPNSPHRRYRLPVASDEPVSLIQLTDE